MVSYLSERYNFVNGRNLLIRNRTILPQKNAGKRYIETHLNSIRVNGDIDVMGKQIIVMDDITTSGASLLACRQLLFEAGAKEVICFAFAKDS
jgi:predicted amidophosphoribosyltransferase